MNVTVILAEPPLRLGCEKMVHIKRQEAECLGYENHPYDALLEDYEPGACCRDLEPLLRQSPAVGFIAKERLSDESLQELLG